MATKIKNCHGKKDLVILQERKRGKGEYNLPITLMNAEVNNIRPWEYSEWLLTEIRELEATIAEDFARYLPWSEQAQEKCKIGFICTEKYQHYFKKEA